MTRQLVQVSAVVAVCLGYVSVTRADDYGTVQDAYKCDKEIAAASESKDVYGWITKTRKAGTGLSAECKAEIEKRQPACMSDRWNQRVLTDPSLNHGDPKGYCFDKTFADMDEQVENDRRKKKEAEENAKREQEQKAKDAAEVAARDLPKASMHDAKLEKAVAVAFKPEFPDSKILKVVLDGWREDLKKDDFGHVVGRLLAAYVVVKDADGKCRVQNELWLQHGNGRSFSGPLHIEGGGASGDEILCSKAEASAKKGK